MTAARSHLLYIVRHGETDWNARGRFQGQTDIPLNAKGKRQARHNADILRHAIAEPRDWAFYASPLTRTMETMQAVTEALDVPMDTVHLDKRLMEVSFGQMEGQTWIEMQSGSSPLPRDGAEKWHFAPPGGESYEMLRMRVAKWLKGLTGPSVVVTHGGVMRALLVLLSDMDIANAVTFDTRQDAVLQVCDGRVMWIEASQTNAH